MKEITAFLLAMCMAVSLAACGSPNASEDVTPSASNEQAIVSTPSSTPDPALDPTPTPSPESGKVLVAYFSATGNTETVANYIAQATGGNLFELVPADPYTSEDLNYNDDSSRVVYEHDNPEAQNIELTADTVDNWDEYDTVFIGYPIWWHIAAWPVNDFVTSNDFTGKTVIPFCTSASSGLGDSGDLLEEMAGTGDWLEGQRFGGGTSQETVQEWVQGLSIAD